MVNSFDECDSIHPSRESMTTVVESMRSDADFMAIIAAAGMGILIRTPRDRLPPVYAIEEQLKGLNRYFRKRTRPIIVPITPGSSFKFNRHGDLVYIDFKCSPPGPHKIPYGKKYRRAFK